MNIQENQYRSLVLTARHRKLKYKRFTGGFKVNGRNFVDYELAIEYMEQFPLQNFPRDYERQLYEVEMEDSE